MTFSSLGIDARAAKAHITARRYVAIATSDARIFAPAAVATEQAVRRIAAWCKAGEPDAASDAVFHGSDKVRAILRETLAGLPAPVRWHATRYVTWLEIGRGDAAAYMTVVPARALDGDSPHVVVLDGRVSDEALPSVICHELGHAIHRPFVAPVEFDEPDTTWTEVEADARLLVAFEDDRDAAARLLLRGEQLANDAAALWGHPCTEHQCPLAQRLRLFRERMDVAADLAARIGREVDAELADQRAAATLTVTEGAKP